MRALEWAVGYPSRVERLMLLCCPVASSADQIAWSALQLAAIEGDPGWRGGDCYDAPIGGGSQRGLGTARRVAHMSYRSAAELGGRFGRRHQDGEHPWLGSRYAADQHEIADGIPGAALKVINSPYGHDSFLIEVDQVNGLLAELLGSHEAGDEKGR